MDFSTWWNHCLCKAGGSEGVETGELAACDAICVPVGTLSPNYHYKKFRAWGMAGLSIRRQPVREFAGNSTSPIPSSLLNHLAASIGMISSNWLWISRKLCGFGRSRSKSSWDAISTARSKWPPLEISLLAMDSFSALDLVPWSEWNCSFSHSSSFDVMKDVGGSGKILLTVCPKLQRPPNISKAKDGKDDANRKNPRLSSQSAGDTQEAMPNIFPVRSGYLEANPKAKGAPAQRNSKEALLMDNSSRRCFTSSTAVSSCHAAAVVSSGMAGGREVPWPGRLQQMSQRPRSKASSSTSDKHLLELPKG